MVVNHNFQIFLDFLEVSLKRTILFPLSLGGATHVAFSNAGIRRGKAISEFRKPEGPRPAPPPSWARNKRYIFDA